MQGKLKCLLFVLCCVFILPSFAQNSVSLFDEFKKEQQWDVKLTLGNALLEAKNITESQKVSVYSELADLAFSSDDFENALLYFKKLEQHTSLNYLPDMHFRAIKMQGVVFYFQGYFQQAIVEYSRAMVIVEKNNKQVELANLLSNIGLAYFEMNNMELTLEYYLKAKEIYEKKGSAQDQADILLNIAGVYIRLSRYESAILFYKEVLKVYQKLADTSGIAQVNNNLGVAYYESSQFDLALHYYQMALRYYISTNDYNKLSTQYTNLANINLILNNVDVAYEQAKLGVQNALKIANHSLELNALHALAKIQFVRGELADSQKSLDKATDLATQYNSVRIKRDAFGTRSLLEASKGNYAEALTLHEKFVA